MNNMNVFTSSFEHRGEIELPAFSGTRVMMMPLVIGDATSIPPTLAHWTAPLMALAKMTQHDGEVGYITIDEKRVQPGRTHRRAGLHVDGVYKGRAGVWGGGGDEGPWASVGYGMLTVSSHSGCRAWNQEFTGEPGHEGECDHLLDQCRPENERLFLPNHVYWVDGLCVHESVPMRSEVERQFVRLSLPSSAPWFEGYTENPLGVLPTGPILARREFMDLA